MRFTTRRRVGVDSLRARRAELEAQLTAAREQAAWELAGDNLAEVADGQIWERQAQALERAMADLDRRIFAAELDAISDK